MARWRKNAALTPISFEKINGLQDIPNGKAVHDLRRRIEDTFWTDDVSEREGMHLSDLRRQPSRCVTSIVLQTWLSPS